MDHQHPAGRLPGIIVYFNLQNLMGSHKKHYALIKIMFLLAISVFMVHISFNRNTIKTKYPAFSAFLGLFHVSKINDADERMFEFRQTA